MLESVEDTRARLETVVEVATPALSLDGDEPATAGAAEPDDILAKIEDAAIEALRRNQQIMGWIHGEMGGWWWAVPSFWRDLLLEEVDNREDFAYQLVPKAMDRLLGPQGDGCWHTYRREWKGKERTFIKAGAAVEPAPAADNGARQERVEE
jgi:hypothetical protein